LDHKHVRVIAASEEGGGMTPPLDDVGRSNAESNPVPKIKSRKPTNVGVGIGIEKIRAAKADPAADTDTDPDRSSMAAFS